MSGGLSTTLTLVSAGLGVWLLLKLSVVGMFNYHLYRLAGATDKDRRQRLGGLMRLERMEVDFGNLVEGLKSDITVPYVPARDARAIAVALVVSTACSIVVAIIESYTGIDYWLSVGLPALVVLGSATMVGFHVAVVETRLWRQDGDECESLYRMLSKSDQGRFPLTF